MSWGLPALFLIHICSLLCHSYDTKPCIFSVPVRNFADYARRTPLMLRATAVSLSPRNQSTVKYDVIFRIFGTFPHRLSNFTIARGANITIGPFGNGKNCLEIEAGTRYTLFLRIQRIANVIKYKMTYKPLPYSTINARFFTKVRKGTIAGISYLVSGCRALGRPENGKVQYTRDRSRSRVECGSGYQVQGVQSKLCNTKSMRWSIRTPFVCARKAFSFSSRRSLSNMTVRERLSLLSPRRLRITSRKKTAPTQEEEEEEEEEPKFNLRSRIPPPKKIFNVVTTTSPTSSSKLDSSPPEISRESSASTQVVLRSTTSEAVTMEATRRQASEVTTEQAIISSTTSNRILDTSSPIEQTSQFSISTAYSRTSDKQERRREPNTVETTREMPLHEIDHKENVVGYHNNLAKSSNDLDSPSNQPTELPKHTSLTFSYNASPSQTISATTERSFIATEANLIEEERAVSTVGYNAGHIGGTWTDYEGVNNVPLAGFGSSVLGCPTYEGSVIIHSTWSGGFDGTAQFSSIVHPIMGGWMVRLHFNVPVYHLDVYTVDIFAASQNSQEFCVVPKHYNKNVFHDLTVGFNGRSTALQGGSVSVISRSFLLGICNPDELINRNIGTLHPFDDQSGNSTAAWITNSTEFTFEPLDVNQGNPSPNKQASGAIALPFVPNQSPATPPGYSLATQTPTRLIQNIREGRCSVAAPSGSLPEGGNTEPLWKGINSNSSIDYNELLHKSILFFEAQRSGRLPQENRIPWRGDSDLKDGCLIGADLTGGWYNSGGNVKSTSLIAFSTTLLAWGAIDYREAYMESGEMSNLLEQIRWATDYLIKCHITADQLVVQVGNYTLPNDDWSPPEDIDPNARPVYIADASNPGADVAADAAAALASASILFRDHNQSAYAQTCLRHATDLYAFSEEFPTEFQSSIRDPQWLSENNGMDDDMAWAATWLYMATQNSSYLTEAENRFFEMDRRKNLFYWGDKSRGVTILLANLSSTPIVYRVTADSFMRWVLANTQLTPSGLLWLDFPGTSMLAANTAFLSLQAMEFAPNLDVARSYYNFARRQLDELVGTSGRQSFVVGVGQNPPMQPHHRGSSCPEDIICSTDIFTSSESNPHILHGALVNGPSRDGSYLDRAGNFIHNNVAITYNAGFQSLVAGLKKASSRNWQTILHPSVT